MADKTVANVIDGHGAENLVSLVLALAMIRELRAALESFVNCVPPPSTGDRFGVVHLGPLDEYDFNAEQLIAAREVYARTGAAAK